MAAGVPQNRYHALVLHPAEPRFVALAAGGRLELPLCTDSERWTPEVGVITEQIAAEIGCGIILRECVHVDIDRHASREPPSPELRRALYLCTARDPERLTPPAVWQTLDAVPALSDDWCRSRTLAWLSANAAAAPGRVPWSHVSWYESVLAWLDAALAQLSVKALGRPRQIKLWDLSALLTLETDAGRLYVKCIPRYFAREAMCTEQLARRFPSCIPRPLATLERAEEGRMLLADFGGTLVRHTPEPVLGMRGPLRALAQLQLACAPSAAELPSNGCAHRPVAELPRDVARALADRVTQSLTPAATLAALLQRLPQLESDCARLAAVGIPETLVHGDFHNGNVSVDARGLVLFDWTDAALTHPFFDLPIALGAPNHRVPGAAESALLTAYLEPWRAARHGAALDAALELALPLGVLYHAVSYHRILQWCGQATRAELGPTLGALLRMAAEMAAPGARCGARWRQR